MPQYLWQVSYTEAGAKGLLDEVVAVAMSLRTAAAGGAHSQTVPLLTPEQLDEATRREAACRPPGAN